MPNTPPEPYCALCGWTLAAGDRSWRPVPDDMAAELKEADAAGCVVLGAIYGETVLIFAIQPEGEEHLRKLWGMLICRGADHYKDPFMRYKDEFTAICWYPKWQIAPSGRLV